MKANRLMRLSGFSLMLGGLLLFLHFVTHSQGETAQFVAMPVWVPSHVLLFIAWMLILLGMVGAYLRQAEEAGALGLAAFLLVFGTGMLAGGGGFWGGAVFQSLDPHIMDPGGAFFASSGAKLAFAVGEELWLAALLLFAIVSLRARVLPRSGAFLIILTVVLAILALTLFPEFGSAPQYYIADLASALLGSGLGIWGNMLWSVGVERAVKSGSVPALGR